jgi:hypothetical protein
VRPRDALAILGTLLVLGGLFVRGAGADPSEATGTGADTRSASGQSDLQTVAPQRGRSVDEERDPGRGPRPHEPVFLEPAATTTERARLGLSSWITPGAPFDHRENPGGVAIGFSISWPAPARELPSSGPSAWRGSAAR